MLFPDDELWILSHEILIFNFSPTRHYPPMSRFQLSRAAFVTVLLAAFLSACGNKQDAQSPASTSATPDQPLPPSPAVANCGGGTPGGRLVIATFADPKTFNPITANETSSTDLTGRMNGGLLWVDSPTEKPYPGLADNWSVAPDNKTWTFHLRKGLRWSDGQPLTVDDVIFTWNDIIYNPDIVNVTRDAFQIDKTNFSVTKIDDDSLQVVTPQIYAPFLEFFGSVPIMPKHILAEAVKSKSFESAYSISTKPAEVVGCGPFRLKEYKQGQYVMLERNPYFWQVDTNGTRLPYLDNVVFTMVPDMNAMSLVFLSGKADLQEAVRPNEYEHFSAEAAKGGFQVLDLGLASEHDMIFFNQNPGNNPKTGQPRVDPIKLKWFRETKFRQAISYAIDRESIVKSALGGYGAPNYNYVSAAATKWYNPNIHEYPYDPAKARALLAEIGIKDRGDGTLADAEGHPIAFVMNSNAGNDRRQKTGVLVQEDLKRLGIQLTFQPLDFNNLIDRMDNSQDFDCILLGWAGGPPDPTYGMNIITSSGFSHEWYRAQKTPSTRWEARLDELMNLQLKTLDQTERKKYYDEVQVILAEQMAMIPTVSQKAFAAARNNIGNVRGTTLDPNRLCWNLEQLYFKKN
jgi:peptide/nickel transport system substrate-binding protein